MKRRERGRDAVRSEERGVVKLGALPMCPALHIIDAVTCSAAYGLSRHIADATADVTSGFQAESEAGRIRRAVPALASKVVQPYVQNLSQLIVC